MPQQQKVNILDLGRIDYKEAWDLQKLFLKEAVDIKVENRSLSDDHQLNPKHWLLLCEHPPVFTLGRSGDKAHLLLNEDGLRQKGIEFYKINRGGDITYHGPGQVVGYPILDLDYFFTDIHKYVRFMEEAVIKTIAEFGLKGIRIKGMSGVWLASDQGLPERKICAVGVHLSRWVTMHGFALNVNTQLDHFNFIVPCGIQGKAVTSIKNELGKEVDISLVNDLLVKHFSELFEFEAVLKKDYEKRYSGI
ncbi:MAG: lipoyl(octanoyl) transferase LipB [Bacteroidota bacterium]